MARPPKGKRVKAVDGAFTVSGKAANGEGSLYREADGTWRATYRVPGESRPRRVRGRTREEALRRRAEALTRALESRPRSPATTSLSSSTTIAELAAWWLVTVAGLRVRPSSLGKYVDRVERITAWLGDVRIAGLRPEQVATWQAQLLGPLSASTVADTRATFRSIVDEAVNLGLLSTNAVDRVRPPAVRAKPRRALSAAETRSLVAAAGDDRLGAAVALLFVQGWRVSEVLGLAWSDLDLEVSEATVSRASVYADGVGMMLGPPKTEGAKGRHHLTPSSSCFDADVGYRTRSVYVPDHAGRSSATKDGRSALSSRRSRAAYCSVRRSQRRSLARLGPLASIPPGSARTPVGPQRSRCCTPSKGWTSLM
jgi:integrase